MICVGFKARPSFLIVVSKVNKNTKMYNLILDFKTEQIRRISFDETKKLVSFVLDRIKILNS